MQRGLIPNEADYDGRTALHLAAAEGHLAAVKYLLSCGARPDATDRWGGTPLTDAKRASNTAIAEYLVAHGSGAEPAVDGAGALSVLEA
ncbi:ankyrin repeat domain-containing protein [Mycobacterium sp. SM1]|nr:ankyrin repeat domain-containing protein [Mycobacterium sp. SM1]